MLFDNEINLHTHKRSFHGGTKIKLEFLVQMEGETCQGRAAMEDNFGYGLNSETFVPNALPEQQS